MTRRRTPAGPRLFVAVDLPDAVVDALSAWVREQRPLRTAVRPVAPESLHLTLVFLGATEPGAVDAVADAVRRVADGGSALGLRTGPPVWLPPRRPRALAVDVEDGRGDLATLHADLLAALRPLVGDLDGRPLRPHVTVGRRRGDAPAPPTTLAATPDLAFDGTAVTLYRSTLDPEGARYDPLVSVPLFATG